MIDPGDEEIVFRSLAAPGLEDIRPDPDGWQRAPQAPDPDSLNFPQLRKAERLAVPVVACSSPPMAAPRGSS